MSNISKVFMLRHNLRSSLTSVKEAVSLVKDGTIGKINAKQKRCLDVANKGIEHMLKIIDKIGKG